MLIINTQYMQLSKTSDEASNPSLSTPHKKLVILTASLVLSACSPGAQTFTPSVIPEGLKDCQFHAIQPGYD